MNIILVVSDTLRRDYLPIYGGGETYAPNLTAFGSRAAIFEDCYAASFPTVPARADILTGRYTFTYLPWGPLPQNEVTLAELLSRAGYRTMAVVDTPFLARRGYGHDRGFQDFIQMRSQSLSGYEVADYNKTRVMEEDYAAPATFHTAARWVERNHHERFFLYIDTWDPHEPWDPPAHYVRRYLPDYRGEVITPTYWDLSQTGHSERDLALARACYRGEISMVDHWFGYLMARLAALGIAEETAVLFTSDHGFYFGEHNQFGKRRFRWKDDLSMKEGFRRGRTLAEGLTYRSPLHNEITRVPLIVGGPGIKPARVRGLVSLPDLAPTILELAGVERADAMQAHSIVPMLRGAGSAAEIAITTAPFEEPGDVTKTVDDRGREIIETSPSSITDGVWDLLYSEEGGPVELYRTEDYGHTHNLYAEHPEAARRLHLQFVAWLARHGAPERIMAKRRNL
jgi:arylsulfatase A-like enzyme